MQCYRCGKIENKIGIECSDCKKIDEKDEEFRHFLESKIEAISYAALFTLNRIQNSIYRNDLVELCAEIAKKENEK